jgi:hypothetical protein
MLDALRMPLRFVVFLFSAKLGDAYVAEVFGED